MKVFLTALSCLLLFSALSPSQSAATDGAKSKIEKIIYGGTPGIETDALLILKDGKTVYESYGRGYGENSKHLSWSMGKSIAGMIAALAIDQGRFELNDPVSKWIPEYKGKATVLDLFQMSSGIQFKEEYSGIPVDSDATQMLYLKGPEMGFANYTISLPMRAGVNPGDHFYYSSGDANILMEVFKRSFKDKKDHDAFPWVAFFDRMGLSGATFEQDSTGTFVGSSYVYMTAKEYSTIGQLVANKGLWFGVRLIPAWYFELMTKVAPGVEKQPLTGTSPTRAYSMQTTTNLPIRKRGTGSEYADLPKDALLMIGHQGQLVISSPSENLVIVRLATDKGDPFNPHRRELFAAIREFLKEEGGIEIKGAGGPNGQVSLHVASKEKQGGASVGDYLKVPTLLKTLYAKELCSCLFVEGRTLTQCKEDMKQTLPLLPFAKIDEEKKTVSTTMVTGISRSRAVYYGPHLGCTLLP